MRSEEHNGGVLPKKVRSMISLQKLWRLGAAVVLVLTALTACGSGDSAAEPDQPAATQAYGNQYAADSNEAGNDAVKDWMKDQANGKDYGDDDGGSYYCMGKNDTCPNKTNNKYDLYCNSCDPDGDNVEG